MREVPALKSDLLLHQSTPWLECNRTLENQENKADSSQLQAERLERERVAQKKQHRRHRFEHLLKECEDRETICCCQLSVNLSAYRPKMRNNSRNRRYLQRLLRHDDDSRDPYAHLSKEDAQIEMAARGLRLKNGNNDSRHALRSALQAADDQRQIDFLRFPKEVRLLVYELVVSENPIGLARPPLLLVNKQVREEASPTFFRLTSFRLQMYQGYAIAKAPKFDSKTIKWLDRIGPDGIKELRHISLTNRHQEYNIDLACSNAGLWTTTLRPRAYVPIPYHTRELCPARRVKTLKARLANAKEDIEQDLEDLLQSGDELDQSAYLRSLIKHKESCQECLQNGMDMFSALCGEGKSVKPTLDGLANLVDAINVKDSKMRDFVNAVLINEV